MKNQTIDTLQWTPSERLRKVLFVKSWEKRTKFNKSFAEALTSAKRCYDVRIVEELSGGNIAISYLTGIGVDEKSGLPYMMFLNGGLAWKWDESVEDQPVGDDDGDEIDIDPAPETN